MTTGRNRTRLAKNLYDSAHQLRTAKETIDKA